VVYSIAGAGDELWVGRQRGGLTRLRYQEATLSAENYSAADGLARGSIYAVHRSRDGTVWAGALDGGLSRLSGGQITTYTTANGLASNTISAIEEGREGNMWFATPNGLASLARGQWRVYTSQDGLPPGRINCLFADSQGILWIGTELGLALLRDGHMEVPRNAPEPLLDEILGLSMDKQGELWIVTANHLLRAPAGALSDDRSQIIPIREFGPADGIVPEGVRRDRSVVQDTAGRIWFSLRSGIAVVDPARLANDSVPALVHLEFMTRDGRPVGAEGPIRIPATTQRVRFAFMALSLSVPGRVEYRYRLDDFDHDWSEPVSGRDVAYTNLRPGTYRFRVMACNSQGIWNSSEASIGFKVVPAVWQTIWFQALMVGGCVVCGVAIYHLRLRRVTGRLRMRFEERLAERTRIAQELHDTLLQGLLATSMQLHVAVEKLPAESTLRPIFARVTSMMRDVATESRTAVRGLRSALPELGDLEGAFSRVRDECAPAEGMDFRIIVEGPRRPLNPLTRNEVYRIGREALNNAFRHSGAARVEMEIRYGARDLRLAVRDDGRGIDEAVLRSGREGHWGLVGMRERAERMGARFRVWSGAAAGTEMELIVPAHVAFTNAAPIGRWWRNWRWNGREKR
jgi:signal transduction histidine kinase